LAIIGINNSNARVQADNNGYQAVGYDHKNGNDQKCNNDNDDKDDKD